jgi:redox-sensitive bicupin YhaK (pirin superfamily)
VQQRQYRKADRQGRLLQIMGPAGEDGLDLAQDARVLVARLGAGDQARHRLGEGWAGYLYVLDGELRLGDERLGGGERVAIGRYAEVHTGALGGGW